MKGGQVVDGSFSDASILNPILLNDAVSNLVVYRMTSPLIRVHEDTGLAAPDLAESWEISADGLTYIFKLRKGVKWHDGKPLTAEDAKFTYETILDPKTKTVRKSLYDEVKKFTVVDPNTLKVEMKSSFCPYITEGATMGVIPKHILEKSADINVDEFNSKKPVGVGPFKFREWVKDSHIILDAYDDYYQGRPNLDRWILRVVRDSTILVAALKTGQVDVGTITEPALLPEVEKTPHLKVHKYFSLGYTFIGYNMSMPFFQDKRVRQALTMAIDRDKLVEKILFREGVVMDSHIPPISPYYDPNLAKFSYSPAKAKELLAAAGYILGPDGFIRDKAGKAIKLTLYTNAGNKIREAVATLSKEQYKAIGVDVDVQLEAFPTLVRRLTETLDYDMVIIGWSLGVDPVSKSIWHSSQVAKKGGGGGFNFINYVNPEVDRLIDEGRTVAGCRSEDRKSIYSRIARILAEEQPYNFGFAGKTLIAVDKRFENVKPSPWQGAGTAGVHWNVYDWWSGTGK